MENIKVKDHLNLERDPRTNAILNTNKNEYEEYIERRNKRRSESQRVVALESEVKDIKNDLNEIKSLLIDLARKQD
tara:strand:+ start:1900 stop:2127 length:228 start_codon:yes stop_codon:yes gene_type:complete